MKINYIVGLFAAVMLPATLFAQEDATIKPIAEKACECAKEIDGTLAKDKVIDAINTCIRTTTLTSQLSAVNAESDAAKKNGDTSKKEYTITLDGNFKEVQAYLNKNCSVVQKLMAATVNPAVSSNKKAMQFFNEGRAYAEEQKNDMAVVSYNKAVKADPKFTTAWNYMGLGYRRMGNYAESLNCYKKSLEIDPAGAMPLQNVAISYEYLKDNKNAAIAYEKFIAAYPDSPEGYYGAGRIFYLLEDYDKGVDYMIKAYIRYKKAESPYLSDARQNLAENYKDLKQKGKEDIFIRAAKNNNIEFK